jgi:hypothetical protein
LTASAIAFRYDADRYDALQTIAVNSLLSQSTPSQGQVLLSALIWELGLNEGSNAYASLRDYQASDTLTLPRVLLAMDRAQLGCVTDSDVRILRLAARDERLRDDNESILIGLALIDEAADFAEDLLSAFERLSEKQKAQSLLLAMASNRSGRRILTALARQYRGKPQLTGLLQALASRNDNSEPGFDRFLDLMESIAMDEDEALLSRYFAASAASSGDDGRPFREAFIRRALRGDKKELLFSLSEYLVDSGRACEFSDEISALLGSPDSDVRITASALFSASTPCSAPVEDKSLWVSVVKRMFNDKELNVRIRALVALSRQAQAGVSSGEFTSEIVELIPALSTATEIVSASTLVCRTLNTSVQQITSTENDTAIAAEVYDSAWIQENREVIAARIKKIIDKSSQTKAQ